MTAVHIQPGQPGAAPAPVVYMPQPDFITGVPPGLEYLTTIDQLLVHQKVELLEAMTGWETKNKYQIKNSMGQQVFFAKEESGTCMRQCCGPNRSFVMHITDNNEREVMRVSREFKCFAGCCWFACCQGCSLEVTVEAPPGQVIGYVRQSCSGWRPRYEVLDAAGETVFHITGPCCICQGICCTWDQDFTITPPGSEVEVGKISKQWSGLVKEMFTQADNFGVTFPVDLSVEMKAVCLGGVFLIDFMYFEDNDNEGGGGGGY